MIRVSFVHCESTSGEKHEEKKWRLRQRLGGEEGGPEKERRRENDDYAQEGRREKGEYAKEERRQEMGLEASYDTAREGTIHE